MTTSYIYFIRSRLFPANDIKVVSSCASASDIMTAHRDVYETSEESESDVTKGSLTDNTFQISDKILIRDCDLLRKSLRTLEPQFCGFLDVIHEPTIRIMIDKINDLSLLSGRNTESSDLLNEIEIETEELIVLQERAAFDQQGQEVGAYESASSLESVFDPQKVATTCVYELVRRPGPHEPLPNHIQFLIFNKGYAYVIRLFKEVFPEFAIQVHDHFPCLDLAEQMLWYQVDHFRERKITTLDMMAKVRAFFDCINTESNVETKKVSVCELPEIEYQQPPIPQKPLPFRKHIMQPPVPSVHVPSNGSVRIRDMLDDEPLVTASPAITGTAPAFQIPASPCGDAFMTGVNLWNSETRRDPSSGPGAESVMVIKDFVGTMCQRARGHKIQSSKLFQAYKEFHKARKPTEKPLAQAQFTILMKQISLFETHRYNNAIYWQDIIVSVTKSTQTSHVSGHV